MVAERVSTFDEMLTTLVSAALAEVTTRQNEDMRKISAWAAIALVPTAIAGIYGMNFEHMPELSWTYGYPMALGADRRRCACRCSCCCVGAAGCRAADVPHPRLESPSAVAGKPD